MPRNVMRPTLPTNIARPRGPDALSDHMRKSICGSEKFVARQRLPNEATPRQINTFAGEDNAYKPEPAAYVRPGADDHLLFKSRGV